MSSTEREVSNEHLFCAEHLGEYLADGLAGEDRSRLESHVAACPECARALADLRTTEIHMNAALSPLTPSADFEDRLIASLRDEQSARWRVVRHAVSGLAAAIVIAGLGYAATDLMGRGKLPFALPGMEGEEVAVAFSENPAARRRGEGEPLAGLATTTSKAIRALQDGRRLPAEVSFGLQFPYALGEMQMDRTVQPQKMFRSQVAEGALAGEALGSAPASSIPPAPVAGLGAASNPGFGEVVSKAMRDDSRDKVTMGGGKPLRATVVLGSPSDSNDSVLLPTDERETEKSKGASTPVPGSPAPQANPAGAGEQAEAPAPVMSDRKIVRTGTAVFEVESYEVAAGKIGEIVRSAGGFIGTSSSENLPNGKVRGMLVLRLPPEQLDGVLARLRGVGELKSENIESADVTRHYVDTEGQLKAARAVEERLLDLIKNGKGAMKDIGAAEKELGDWRTKIESLEGELRYLSSQVAYSTLTLTVAERDIRAAATAVETESVTAAVEVADVSAARGALVEFIGAAKGRVLESELRQQENGQTVGSLVGEVPQESSGGLSARVKSLGEVSKYEVQRKQTLEGDAAGAAPKLEQRMTRVSVSLFSQEAMVPRLSQTVEFATADVAATHAALLAKLRAEGDRIVSSTVKVDPSPSGTEATLAVVLPADRAEALLSGLDGVGQVLRMQGEEAPLGPNVTQAKRAITVHFIPATRIAPRESRALSVQTADLAGSAERVVRAAAAAGARILESSGSTSAGGGAHRISLELPSTTAGGVLAEVRSAGTVTDESSTLDVGAVAGPLSRTRIDLTLASPPQLVGAEDGLGTSLRSALSTSLLGLLWSLKLLVIGVCLVLPWVGLVWVGARVWRRRKV
jgi:hypothetical protein